MKKILKITAMFLIISTLICLFGCKDKAGDDVSDKNDGSGKMQNGDLLIVDDGKSDYVVVWRGQAKDAEKSAAFDLCEWIEKSTGAKLEKKWDTSIKNAEEFSQMKKIVVGRLDNYAENKWNDLGENDYCIETQEGDVYIYGGSSQAVYAAVLAFQKKFLTQQQSSLAISSDFVLEYEGAQSREDYINDPFSMIPVWIDEFQTPAKMLDFTEKKKSFADPNGRVMSMIHRSDTEHYPENSIEGIISAMQMGADIIEVDVRYTKDGIAVLSHDATLSRTTNYSTVKGTTVNGIKLPTTDNLTDWTLEQLRCLKLQKGNGDGTALTEYVVPTLEEVMTVTKGRCFIILDKVKIYTDFRKMVLPIMKKLNSYDNIIMLSDIGPEAATLIKNEVKNLPQNTDKSVPHFIDGLDGNNPLSWKNAITTDEHYDLVSFYFFGGMVGGSTDFSKVLTQNENYFKDIKGEARLQVDAYKGVGNNENTTVYEKCAELGLNVIFVEKTLGIQEFICNKYFS